MVSILDRVPEDHSHQRTIMGICPWLPQVGGFTKLKLTRLLTIDLTMTILDSFGMFDRDSWSRILLAEYLDKKSNCCYGSSREFRSNNRHYHWSRRWWTGVSYWNSTVRT